MPMIQTYTQMSDIVLCSVPWDKEFNNVYYPSKVTKSSVISDATSVLTTIKSAGATFSGCRPVRSSNYFILNIPFEEAKKYNYVCYKDNDVLFRRGGTSSTVSKEVTTYDVTTGCIEITFNEGSAPSTPVAYTAYKNGSTYEYWDYEGTKHTVSKTYENSYQRSGGEIVERYAFIESFVPINDFLTGFCISCDYWMQYVVFGNLHFENNTLFKRFSVKDDTRYKWRMPEQITPVRYIQSDEQFMHLNSYMDGYGTWHLATSPTEYPAFCGSETVVVAFCTDLKEWSADSSGTSGTSYLTIGNFATSNYDETKWDGGFNDNTVIGVDERFFIGNAYNGLYALVFSRLATSARINSMLTANIGSVLNVVTMPATIIHTLVAMHVNNNRYYGTNTICPVIVGRVEGDGTEKYQGYTPRYNKQYLENFIYVADGCGTTNCFRRADFKDNLPLFRVTLPFAPDAVLSLTPLNYNRKCIENTTKSIYVGGSYFTPNFSFTFCTSPIPNSSYTSNAYQAYLAQNGGLDNMYKQVQLSNAVVTNDAQLSNAQYNLTQNQNALNGKLNEATLNYNLATYNATSLSNVGSAVSGLLGATGSATKGNALGGASQGVGNITSSVANQYQADSTWKYNQQNYGIQQSELNLSTEYCEYAKSKIWDNANCQKQQNELSLQMALSGAKATPDSGVTGTNLQTAHERRFGVFIWESTWSWIDANILDKFFDKYGYLVNEYVDVGTNSTTYVNPVIGHLNHDYVETEDCKLYRDNSFTYISDEELKVVETMFNAGIHVWHNVANMYDFTATNTRITSLESYTLSDGVERYSGGGF